LNEAKLVLDEKRGARTKAEAMRGLNLDVNDIERRQSIASNLGIV
jgi:hypothetical protein